MRTTANGPVNGEAGLRRYLSPMGAWALAFGCAVGWGAFVMPGTTFLPIAGPLGTTIGMAIGGLVMLIIGINYHFMIGRHPDAGSTYTYATRTIGSDHGFLSAWLLILVYIAIIWANATALPLIFRNLLGGAFQVGFHYEIAGFDVYFGEAILSLAALLVFGLVCAKGGRFASVVQTVMAALLAGGLVIGIISALHYHGGALFRVQPSFAPGNKPFSSVMNIAALAPWAFVGFESISHSVEEFRFSTKRTLPIVIVAVVTSALAYIFLSLIAVSALPEGYASWVDYIKDIGNLPGLEGLPTFHAVGEILGPTGLAILGVTVVAAVITGLVGNYTAVSRLLFAVSRDNVLPGWFGRLSGNGTPKNAVFFVMLVSIPISFLGRTAIGWIVDVSTIGATIVYAYTSAVAMITAYKEKNLPVQITGALGVLVSILFFLYFMVPNFWTVSALATESYLILAAWGILGFAFFRYAFKRDKQQRFGRSTVVWVVLLALIFFISMLWMRESMHNTTEAALDNVSAYSTEVMRQNGVVADSAEVSANLQTQKNVVDNAMTRNGLIQGVLILIAMFFLFNIYRSVMQREKATEVKKAQAEESSRAKSTFLSNMSHDIRTPMNAIVGYTALAKKEPELPPKAAEYLGKIEVAGGHLLSLINDILEMSRIESGKMELEPEKSDLRRVMDGILDLFNTQMEAKGIRYEVATELQDPVVLCDANRLNRVLLNLISNAYKFTPEGGTVSVRLIQTGAAEGQGTYALHVKDSGIGMSPEFAAHVFEAYTRDRTVNKIEGTGLGMAITKSIVDLMDGAISVETEPGKGTEFIVRVQFPILARPEEEEEGRQAEAGKSMDWTKIHLLLVEDNEINLEIAEELLGEMGFQLDSAENGKVAVEKVASMPPETYQAILMDVQMPVMNGYEATRAIRALPDPVRSSIPIIAMTANAFVEDVKAARAAGMNGHVAKPIDIRKLMDTILEVIG